MIKHAFLVLLRIQLSILYIFKVKEAISKMKIGKQLNLMESLLRFESI